MSLLNSFRDIYQKKKKKRIFIESKAKQKTILSFTWKLACHLKLHATELAALLRHQDLFLPPNCQSLFHLEKPSPPLFAIKFHMNTSQLPNLLAFSFVYLYSMWSRANAPVSLQSYSCTKCNWEKNLLKQDIL